MLTRSFVDWMFEIHSFTKRSKVKPRSELTLGMQVGGAPLSVHTKFQLIAPLFHPFVKKIFGIQMLQDKTGQNRFGQKIFFGNI